MAKRPSKNKQTKASQHKKIKTHTQKLQSKKPSKSTNKSGTTQQKTTLSKNITTAIISAPHDEQSQEEAERQKQRMYYQWYAERVKHALILKKFPREEIPYKLLAAAEHLDFDLIKKLMAHPQAQASPYFFDVMGRYTAIDCLKDKESEICTELYIHQIETQILNKKIPNKQSEYLLRLNTVLLIQDYMLSRPKLTVPDSTSYQKPFERFETIILQEAQRGRLSPLDIAQYLLKATVALNKNLVTKLMGYPGAQLARQVAFVESNSIVKNIKNNIEKFMSYPPPNNDAQAKYQKHVNHLLEKLKTARALRLTIAYWDFTPPTINHILHVLPEKL